MSALPESTSVHLSYIRSASRCIEYQNKVSKFDDSTGDEQLDFQTVDLIKGALKNMKNYVPALQDCSVVAFDDALLQEINDDAKYIQLFRITELVYQEDEFSVHKLATVFNACMTAM